MIALQVVGAVMGLLLLARAADQFVLGASELSRRFGVSQVVIGAVVIGFGTSAPEGIVSGLAAIGGNADVGMGNIVGSNLANLTLVLGIAGLVGPLTVSSGALRREAPATVAAMALFAYFAQGGLARWEGIVLAVALVVATAAIVAVSSRETSGGLAEDVDDFLEPAAAKGAVPDVVRTGLGLAGTLAGAQLLVWSAVGLADAAGLSGGFVGLTLVAIGTSLPEIVTAAQAARRGDSDLIVGNLLGSNTVNSLGVGAIVGIAAPNAEVDPAVLGPGVLVMMGASVTALVLMRRRFTLTRGEGLALVLSYSAVVPLLA